jgi:hypothetical protein
VAVPTLITWLLVGCYRDAPPSPPPRRPAAPHAAPLKVTQPAPSDELYALDEALEDALSAPLVHVGTGDWFGLFRIKACVYRNDRVFVVNIYCTTKEMSSFGLVVLSPTRGRVYIYAEASAPISTLRRADYFTFKGESSPARADEKLPPLKLTFSRAQLRVWDETRYYRNIPGCFGGAEFKPPVGIGCLPELASRAQSWGARNKAFLENPPPDWYRIVGELRSRATTDGKHVDHPGG